MALIEETKTVSSILQKKELLKLLEHKIEQSVLYDKGIGISMESVLVRGMDTIYVEDYEVNEKKIYLSGNNLELNIINDMAAITYENNVYDEVFVISTENESVQLYF